MANLTEVETYTLALLAAANRGEAVPAVSGELWESVREELSAQAVLAVPADAVDELGLSGEAAAEYLARVGRNLSDWYSLMIAQDQALALLRSAGIPVAVLKGAAAAMYYPQPERRAMGDIDLIVHPDNFQRAFELFVANGWENDQALEINPRHAGLSKPGFPEIELHRYFSISGNQQQDSYLDQSIYNGLARVQQVDAGGFSVPVLPPLENGLVLLAHINQHLGSGLGLRQIIDWQMFVEAQLSDELWNNGFARAARAVGMERLAVTTTALCRSYLGLKRPITWCDGADSTLVDELIEYVMHRGNMGRKVEHGAQSTRVVLHNFRNPIAAVKQLYASGCFHWAPARHHKLLAPLAVLYGIGNYARKGLARGASLGQLKEDALAAQREVDLLERLGVTKL